MPLWPSTSAGHSRLGEGVPIRTFARRSAYRTVDTFLRDGPETRISSPDSSSRSWIWLVSPRPACHLRLLGRWSLSGRVRRLLTALLCFELLASFGKLLARR